jgi:hypothetical protein
MKDVHNIFGRDARSIWLDRLNRLAKSFSPFLEVSMRGDYVEIAHLLLGVSMYEDASISAGSSDRAEEERMGLPFGSILLDRLESDFQALHELEVLAGDYRYWDIHGDDLLSLLGVESLDSRFNTHTLTGGVK